MSGAMLHGMGDCTPSLHCGCMSHAPLREQVVALTAERDDLLEQRDDLYESLAARTKDVNRMLAERDRVRAEVEKCQRLVREGLLTPEDAFHVIGNVVAGYTTAALAGESDA